jgi:hypothetical protein
MNTAGIAARANAPVLALRSRRHEHNIVPCFVCNATFSYKGCQGDLNGRFCSIRCQAWFDAGNAPPCGPDDTLIGWRDVTGSLGTKTVADFYALVFGRPSTPMKRSSDGFRIACGGCGKDFDSRGRKCCSDACERRFRERETNRAVMAEVGIEPSVKRRCAALGCANTIPKWSNGRRVSTARRFCSKACGQRARKLEATAC